MTSAEELKMLAAKLVAMLNDEQGQGMATWKIAVCNLISQLAREVGLDDQLREEGMQQAAKLVDEAELVPGTYYPSIAGARESLRSAAAAIRVAAKRTRDQ